MASASTETAWPGVSEDEAQRLAGAGIRAWPDLVDVDPLMVSDQLGLSPDLLVALVAEARRRVAVRRPPPETMEAVDALDEGGFVEVPSSARRDRGARLVGRVHAVRERLRKARRRAKKKGDAGPRTLRRLKRCRVRLRKLADELEEHGVSRRRAEVVASVVDRIDTSVTTFMDRRPTRKRVRRLRRRVEDALERLD